MPKEIDAGNPCCSQPAVQTKKELEVTEAQLQEKPEDLVLFITSESLGQGSEELGLTLIRNFILTLLDNSKCPAAILFVNSGVKLCCEGSPVLEYLITLHNQDTKVLSCGTCLNFYGQADKLQAGKSTTMVTIVEYITGPYKVVTL